MIQPNRSADSLLNDQDIERRTQQLGKELYQLTLAHRPTLAERLQDDLLVRLSSDQSLMKQLLAFVDVSASLDFDRSGRQMKRLYHEYIEAPLPLPLPIGWLGSRIITRSIPAPAFRVIFRYLINTLARRFISPPSGGISKTLSYLESHGRYPSFDILGEAVLSKAEATTYKEKYLELIKYLGSRRRAVSKTIDQLPAMQISLKLSSLTPDFNPADSSGVLREVRPALEELATEASKNGIALTVDAEQYEYRDLSWFLFKEIFAKGQPLGSWPGAGIVLQAYLVDSESHLQDMLRFASQRGVPFQIRLVKGAYWDLEKIVADQKGWNQPVYQVKSATDSSFERLACILLAETQQVRLAVGSHNIRSHAFVEAVRENLGLQEQTVEHQTLYKTWEGLSRSLQKMGWVERDYTPVGELLPGMAYLVRRILENSSQLGFLARSRVSSDISKELAKPSPSGDVANSSPLERLFTNSPPKRMFIEEERNSFAQELNRTRNMWGNTYRLTPQLTGSNPTLTFSKSPSHLDSPTPVGVVEVAGIGQANKAIEIANRGFVEWNKMGILKRCSVLQRAANIMASQRDELASWVVHEGGKDWAAALADVDESIDYLRFYAQQALANEHLIDTTYRPRGVVAVIRPGISQWRFPAA